MEFKNYLTANYSQYLIKNLNLSGSVFYKILISFLDSSICFAPHFRSVIGNRDSIKLQNKRINTKKS